MAILSHYLQEIGKTPLLTAQEERELGARIQQGESLARQRMLLSNLRLVVNVAKQYVPGNEPDLLMDLIQEGNIGLMRAVDRFKPEFKTRFSTYGVYWIRQAVLRSLKARRLVRLPENVFDKVLAMQRIKSKLSQILGRTPTNKEAALEMGTSLEEISEMESFSSDIVSLERTVRIGEDNDFPSPSQVVDDAMDRKAVRRAVYGLPIREREILNARFGLSGNVPQTLEEIGEGFHISRERVRQLQNVALERLRHRRKVRRMV